MTSSSADPAARLARALLDLFDQVPDLQRRYRAAMSRIPPDQALGLADAWTGFQRALAGARYDPVAGGLLHTTDPTGQPPQEVMWVVADLSDARIRLREQLEAAEAAVAAAGPAAGAATPAGVLARWRLLRRGEPQLRWAVAQAMAALPSAEGCLESGSRSTSSPSWRGSAAARRRVAGWVDGPAPR